MPNSRGVQALHTPRSEPRGVYRFERRTFLLSAGYQLPRPKFHPDFASKLEDLSDQELDEHIALHPRPTIMDAQRLSDGKDVILKVISTKTHPHELDVAQFFSAQPLADNPRNHCIPVLQVLQDPDDVDNTILVMPLFQRFDLPIFETVGEVIDCFRQLFQGIEFMHENFVAHRIQQSSIPTAFIRRKPGGAEIIADWLILSLAPSAGRDGPPLKDVILGGDRTPPEHIQTACNPFPTDIYFLGNLLKQEFVYSQAPYASLYAPRTVHRPLRFLKPLVKDMMLKDPSMRPTIGEVTQRFDRLCHGLSGWHLRRPGRALHWYGEISQFFQQMKNMGTRVPPIPAYTPRARTALTDAMRAFYTQAPRASESSGHTSSEYFPLET
ncbi:hypothetical protein C8R46DRAFT_1246005 [Mycena filopes]|nr:hypothetical protein C8R46DRAFT_1246005 [Mycena filopes]